MKFSIEQNFLKITPPENTASLYTCTQLEFFEHRNIK